ncbi:MAG: hypothetical protein NUW00_04500 [Candidatus Kaiserbacteria bacterium]|nr:hypothetical protein [Candidatus Kaiserbacteria bacterium]
MSLEGIPKQNIKLNEEEPPQVVGDKANREFRDELDEFTWLRDTLASGGVLKDEELKRMEELAGMFERLHNRIGLGE